MDGKSGTTGGRVVALDGLRGVAAAVVVLHHLSLLVPTIAAPFVLHRDLRGADVGSGTWWWTRTPLKVATMGPEAVAVFFVLSGLVLATPALRAGTAEPSYWWAFLRRRVVRLGGPWLGAVAVAAGCAALAPLASADLWTRRAHMGELSLQWVVSALDPTWADFRLNPPLWSLRWELVFSVLLPVYLLLGRLLARSWFLALALVVLTETLGQAFHSPAWIYLPTFLVGVLLACSADRLQAFVRRVDAGPAPAWVWSGLLAAGLGVFALPWLLGVGPSQDTTTRAVLHALWPAAAALVVVACCGESWLSRALRGARAQYLGRISFSLYLVHLPVLLAVWVTTPWLPPAGRAVLAVLAVWAVAEAFHRLVEAPTHRLARRIGAPAPRALVRTAS